MTSLMHYVSQTHIDTSLTSQRELKEQLHDQFNQVQLQEKYQKLTKPSNYEQIINEIRNHKKSMENKLSNLQKTYQLNQEQIPAVFNQERSSEIDNQRSNGTYEISLAQEQEQILLQQLKRLRTTISGTKKQIHPLEQQIHHLRLQDKKATEEQEIAQFEQNRLETMKQQLTQQIQRLRFKRESYKAIKIEEGQLADQDLRQTQNYYDATLQNIEELKGVIREQEEQIKLLDHQQQDKIEQSEQQIITIKNYQGILRLYEYYINLTDKLEISVDENENIYTIEDEDRIIQNDETEQSDLQMNNFFQTAINVQIEPKKPQSSYHGTCKSLYNIESQKQLISQVRQDISIKIMEDIILDKYREYKLTQKQLTDQYFFLIQSIDEKKEQLIELQTNILVIPGSENIVECEQPQIENFNQRVITKNIARTSVSNFLETIKSIDKQKEIEQLVLSINTKAYTLVKRICSMLQSIYQKRENISSLIIKTFQQIFTNISLLKDKPTFDFGDYPKFKNAIRGNNLTMLYFDQELFTNYKDQLVQVNDDHLTENIYIIENMCLDRLASETKYFFDQIVLLQQTLSKEITRLLNYGSLKSCKDLAVMPTSALIAQSQAAKKMKEYTDSKISDLMQRRRQNRLFMIRDTSAFQLIDKDASTNYDDDIDEQYQQIKKDLEVKPNKQMVNLERSQTKTTLVYENCTTSPMQGLINYDKKVKKEIAKYHLKELSKNYDEINKKSVGLKQFIDQEQKSLKLLQRLNTASRQSRAPSSSIGQLTTYRPESEGFEQQSLHQNSQKRLLRNHSSRVVLAQARKDVARMRTQMKKIQEIKQTHL